MKKLSPNDLGTFLIEDCNNIGIHNFLKIAKLEFRRSLLESEIVVSGFRVRLTETALHHGGTRFWFLCSGCGKRRGVLYKHPLTEAVACRKCLGLGYGKQRYNKMLESEIYSLKNK
jgi:hypothetical protein